MSGRRWRSACGHKSGKCRRSSGKGKGRRRTQIKGHGRGRLDHGDTARGKAGRYGRGGLKSSSSHASSAGSRSSRGAGSGASPPPPGASMSITTDVSVGMTREISLNTPKAPAGKARHSGAAGGSLKARRAVRPADSHKGGDKKDMSRSAEPTVGGRKGGDGISGWKQQGDVWG